jgi:hypothetical protein
MRSPRAVALKPMSERELDKEVRKWATTFGWLVYHTHRSDFSPAGFPDLCLIRPPRVIFAEEKSDARTAQLSPAQEVYRDLLRQCPGVEWYLWRPADLEDIVRILR